MLFGFSAFNREDARRAGTLVLERGAARIKPARGIGGRGQTVVSTVAELNEVLQQLDVSELSRFGIVIEQNFDSIVTHSVGQVQVGELLASYYGIQRLTKDNSGRDVYGGSALVVARGDYDCLLNLKVPPNARVAIHKAQIYEGAVSKVFPDWIASRRNYDVAEVTDSEGGHHFGVLEQSWRVRGRESGRNCGARRISRRPVTFGGSRLVDRDLWRNRDTAGFGISALSRHGQSPRRDDQVHDSRTL